MPAALQVWYRWFLVSWEASARGSLRSWVGRLH
uniref:Uncharacterized protein n=1 Tax=Arundo donax TaxID=35708 RepID=A0A0A8YZM0_ARUDO